MSERYIMKKNEIKNVIEKSNKEAKIEDTVKKSNIEAETKNILKRSNKEAETKNKAEQINNKNTEQKKKFTIMGLSVWRIMAYFIIYSVVGYIIETIFGIITKGVWESRQSFLYGPFCAIYGLGATIMIIFLHKYSKNYTRLFIGGFIVGSIVEYLVSWIGEILLGVKWWDYSDMPLNINGRICVYFSIFWGFLALYLIASFNPRIDRLINWIKSKLSVKALKAVTTTVTILLLVDCIATGIALSFFLIRMVNNYDINVQNKEIIVRKYNDIYSNEKLSKIIYKYWGDRKMLRTFPNLKVQDVDGNMIYMDNLLSDIQPYYYKFDFKK